MRFSVEWKIGVAITLLALLIDPSHAGWRVAILVVACLIFLDAARLSDWTRGKSEALSITNGIITHEARSLLRLAFAFTAIIVLVGGYGVVTWPTKPAVPAPLQLVMLPLTPSPAEKLPTLKGILPPSIPVTPVAPNPPLPKPNPQKPKSPSQSQALYPIVWVTQTQVTRNADTHQLTINITYGNTTNTEVNATITVGGFWTIDGSEGPRVNPASRDVGLAPPPGTYTLSSTFPFTVDQDKDYTNGDLILTLVGQVSYPDRGGKTIYHFTGVTNSKLDHLDLTQSDWEHTPNP